MNVIEAENLAKTFRVRQKEKGMKGSLQAILRPRIKEVQAVDGISFSVEAGEMLAFIGPNGAGKSTTIKMVTGAVPECWASIPRSSASAWPMKSARCSARRSSSGPT